MAGVVAGGVLGAGVLTAGVLAGGVLGAPVVTAGVVAGGVLGAGVLTGGVGVPAAEAWEVAGKRKQLPHCMHANPEQEKGRYPWLN